MNNEIASVIECCRKRAFILEHSRSMREYNKYYDKMRKYMRSVIDSKRECDLLPYLNDENISVRFDMAILLYNSYPSICKKNS